MTRLQFTRAGVGLVLSAAVLSGCAAVAVTRAGVHVAATAVRTTAHVAGTAARVTVAGAGAAAHAVTGGDDDDDTGRE